jgi:hypothetical protein
VIVIAGQTKARNNERMKAGRLLTIAAWTWAALCLLVAALSFFESWDIKSATLFGG